jgi:hypothetical protein
MFHREVRRSKVLSNHREIRRSGRSFTSSQTMRISRTISTQNLRCPDLKTLKPERFGTARLLHVFECGAECRRRPYQPDQGDRQLPSIASLGPA